MVWCLHCGRDQAFYCREIIDIFSIESNWSTQSKRFAVSHQSSSVCAFSPFNDDACCSLWADFSPPTRDYLISIISRSLLAFASASRSFSGRGVWSMCRRYADAVASRSFSCELFASWASQMANTRCSALFAFCVSTQERLTSSRLRFTSWLTPFSSLSSTSRCSCFSQRNPPPPSPPNTPRFEQLLKTYHLYIAEVLLYTCSVASLECHIHSKSWANPIFISSNFNHVNISSAESVCGAITGCIVHASQSFLLLSNLRRFEIAKQCSDCVKSRWRRNLQSLALASIMRRQTCAQKAGNGFDFDENWLLYIMSTDCCIQSLHIATQPVNFIALCN